MSKEKTKKGPKEDEGTTFDMYHFFSRKDVALIGLLILALLIYLLFHFLGSGSAV